MSEKKITYCKDIMESKEKYTEYIENHIKAVKECYDAAEGAFREIFPNVYKDDQLLSLLLYNINNHDNSKFDDDEFWSYAMRFFPINSVNPKSKKVMDSFNRAWLHHIHNNPHHPAHWALAEDNKIMTFDMPDIYIIEMLCDWMAMSKYYNSTTLEYWQSDSAKKLPMSIYTVYKVDEFMDWLIKNNIHTLW